MSKYGFFVIAMLSSLCILVSTQEENRETKQHPELNTLVKHWAQKLGGELWHFGQLVTRRNKVLESFKSTTIVKEDGNALLNDIHERISEMMYEKVQAVRRIMDIAEQAAQAQKDEDVNYGFQFVNTKNLTNSAPNSTQNDQEIKEPETLELRYDDSFITSDERYQAMVQPEEGDGYQRDQDPPPEDASGSKDFDESETDPEVTDATEKDPQASQVPQVDKSRLPLYRNRHFYNIPVNVNYSAVHVPSNVYERSDEVISGIIWSEKLDKTFRNNYENDPTLSWQYFGSSTGFMRQFPAMIWSEEPVDLFDCRTRSWYIEAASSPKDVIILVDRSGSMTGMRREIARHVVHNILDTLGNNDYVNIFTFSNTTEPLVDCYDEILVQANLANVRVLKEAMVSFKTEQIANFSLALVTAFELLETYRDIRKGANCNQAIMLVTDGVQYNYKEIFEKYNWQHLPFVNVRVFTYLIGREVSDVREVKWMACANRGYYVHLSTYAEVREEVLHYIPVMARPMVLNPTQKPNPTWSPVYADVTDPKLTNWLWVNRERNRQRERFLAYRRNKTLLPPNEQDKKFVHQQKYTQDNYGELQTYRLMTSVSLPVYDKKPRANITEKIQINEAIWEYVTREERVANLLGVAGTDIPIEYIQRLMLPHRLGVNGYAFIVTNNGYILIHPDLRPVFQGILKPAYNRVDMTEIEVMDDNADPREFSDEIKEFRRLVVMQKTGNISLKVKTHLDEMRRIVTSTRHYHFKGINGTPFSLVIALPHKYGYNRIEQLVENDIHRIRVNNKGSLLTFFTGNWTIHPDWHYCRYLDDRHFFKTPEEELLHFLKKMEDPGWKWTKECDRKLITNVVADAKFTTWFNDNITTTTKEENGCSKEIEKSRCEEYLNAIFLCRAEFIRRHGIVVAFLAMHSGLTRWQDFPQNIDPSLRDDPHFHIMHNRAIDEVWYRRAVDNYIKNPTNFIYSVPFDIGEENNTLVTVSHAIFLGENTNLTAPAAVIGYQFYHKALLNIFRQITGSCGGINCKRTCESSELHCVMLDNNGYVIVSDNPGDTGHFFGKIRPDIMAHLLEENIYRTTRMYDYQGLCPEEQETTSPASGLLTPLKHINKLLNWMAATLITLARSVLASDLETLMYPEEEHEEHELTEHEQEELEAEDQPPSKFNDKEFDQRLLIKKTKPEPCDNEMHIYDLVRYTDRNISNSGYNKSMIDCTRPFIVQGVSYSNMVLLVINKLCRQDDAKVPKLPHPVQVDYNMSFSCYRALHSEFPRRHYMSCINRNANESEIKLCGGAGYATLSKLVTFISILVMVFH